jgi:Flp pilus assembly protein TadD
METLAVNAPGNDGLAQAAFESDGGLSTDAMAQFMSGHLRDELGLTSDVLNVGLTVARNHILRGAHGEAMRIYIGLVMCEPMNVDFQVGLANCANLMGEPNVALQAASAAIMLAPSDPRGYLLSGQSCIMMGNVDEAREDLNDALRHASGNDAVVREAEQLLERIAALAAS